MGSRQNRLTWAPYLPGEMAIAPPLRPFHLPHGTSRCAGAAGVVAAAAPHPRAIRPGVRGQPGGKTGRRNMSGDNLGWLLFPEQRAVALNRSSRSIRLGHPRRLLLHWLS